MFVSPVFVTLNAFGCDVLAVMVPPDVIETEAPALPAAWRLSVSLCPSTGVTTAPPTVTADINMIPVSSRAETRLRVSLMGLPFRFIR